MTGLHIGIGVAVIGLNLSAAAWGVWSAWRLTATRVFWVLLRTAQAVVVVQAAWGGALLIGGREPHDDLHYVYGLAPLLVSFAAEGMRAGTAAQVLARRGHASALEVGSLPQPEQHAIVAEVLRREIGVMAISGLVVAALALRAAFVL